jgi:hypothetical protein
MCHSKVVPQRAACKRTCRKYTPRQRPCAYATPADPQNHTRARTKGRTRATHLPVSRPCDGEWRAVRQRRVEAGGRCKRQCARAVPAKRYRDEIASAFSCAAIKNMLRANRQCGPRNLRNTLKTSDVYDREDKDDCSARRSSSLDHRKGVTRRGDPLVALQCDVGGAEEERQQRERRT